MPTSCSLVVRTQSLAGDEPQQLVAEGGKPCAIPGSQLRPLVPTQAVGQDMGSSAWFGIDKALSKVLMLAGK